MKRIGNIILRSLILIFSTTCWAQEIDVENEVMQGYAEYQSGQFGKALSHFDIVIDFINQSQIEEIPEEALLSIYLISGSCAQAIGNYNKSLDYCNRALAIQNIPEEYLTTLLNTKLQLCDDLAIQDECIATEKKLLKLYEKNKDIGILQTVANYYLAQEKYEDIILFEPDISSFRCRDDSEIHMLSDKIAMENIYNALGKSFFELSDYDKSLKFFFKALDFLTEATGKDKALIYAYISKAYDKIGDRENCIRYLEMSIELE